MARGRGRPPAPPPPYGQFNSKRYQEFIQAWEPAERQRREASDAKAEVEKLYCESGLDQRAWAFIKPMRKLVAKGKMTVEEAIATVDRVALYADMEWGVPAAEEDGSADAGVPRAA